MDLKEIPQVDLAIVEGGVRTETDEKLIREVRAKPKTLMAVSWQLVVWVKNLRMVCTV